MKEKRTGLQTAPMMNSMKSFTKYLTFNIPARMDFVNITDQVEERLRESGIKEGLCLVKLSHFALHVQPTRLQI
jgi:hypothetical protein